jgi:uncharacterized membrane protein YcaP (DUF421 family)
LSLVVNGMLLHKSMKLQQITDDEVLAQLRMHGHVSPAAVKRATLEGDGHISVILRSRQDTQPGPRQGPS